MLPYIGRWKPAVIFGFTLLSSAHQQVLTKRSHHSLSLSLLTAGRPAGLRVRKVGAGLWCSLGANAIACVVGRLRLVGRPSVGAGGAEPGPR